MLIVAEKSPVRRCFGSLARIALRLACNAMHCQRPELMASDCTSAPPPLLGDQLSCPRCTQSGTREPGQVRALPRYSKVNGTKNGR